jgi:hypothetical protein
MEVSGQLHALIALPPGKEPLVLCEKLNEKAEKLKPSNNWTSGFRFPAGAGIFSLRYSVQIGFGVHSASYLMNTGGKAAGACS